jgi:hypothetical protein
LQKRRKFLSNFPEKKTTGQELLEIVEMTEYADVKTKYLVAVNNKEWLLPES